MAPKYKYTEVISFWKNKNIKSIEDINNILDNFSVLFAYNSGTIENKKITYEDTREIFENGKVINYTGDLKTLYEIRNQKICYEFILPLIIKKEKISEKLIKEIHKKLTENTYDEKRYIINNERPGEYKKHDYVVGINEVGSSYKNVKLDIEQLVEEINNVLLSKDEDIIKAGAYLHNMIEQIHPFADGNGRLGRTLLNYFLMINNLPPIIIYNDDKNFYYEVLRKFDEENNLDSTIEFFKYQMEKTWQKTIDCFKGNIKKENIINNYLKKKST